jgi:hypothetical protein
LKEHFAELKILVQRQVDAEAAVVEAEAALAAAKATLENLKSNVLPNYMQNELGLSELKLDDGRVVKCEKKLRGSISKDNMRAAYNWCIAQGIKTLIRQSLTVDIGPEAQGKLGEILDGLEAHKLPVTSVLAAHPQTVAKFCRERLEAGKALPETIFTTHEQTEVSIK